MGPDGNERPATRRSYAGHDNDDVLAAIDLGTNNCRLMIAARANSGFRVVDSYSRIVRLGEGLQKTGELGEDAMARTLDALHTCAVRLGRRPPSGFRAVATEACRRARNGREFIRRIHDETGLRFEIISGREEAELAVESCSGLLFSSFYRGAAGTIKSASGQPAPTRGLLLDIGGGSTEIAWVRLDHGRRTHDVIGYISLPIGVITLSEQFSSHRPDDYRVMVQHVHHQLKAFETTHRINREILGGGVRVVGTSGTVTTLASLDLDLPRYSRCAIDGYHLGVMNAHKAIARLHRMGVQGMHAHPCIGSERASYVLPGCAIFEAFLSHWSSDIVVADRGLRDGLLTRMMSGNGLAGGRRNGLSGARGRQHRMPG
ncbi:Ppx/GppA family phosphatase [Acetobacter sp. LMG 1636]|uniref:Ppx/GppA family phosphatase n=1 Tax=Acetobacter fallax TaxID=1737473 RepID=A0ABX0K478_9PROT|nr:Ppx/GppA family phosphatase [Acetobacter fallax]NHO34736.1 Ppx/GppA family phosphatase [Acetobacter fallax]